MGRLNSELRLVFVHLLEEDKLLGKSGAPHALTAYLPSLSEAEERMEITGCAFEFQCVITVRCSHALCM